MIEPRLDEPAERRPLWARLAWMLFIWAASITVLGLVAFLIRLWLGL